MGGDSVIGRRSFLAYGVGMLASVASAQKAELQNGKAVVCDEDVLTCPGGHKTCRNIDAPIVVGSDRNLDNPDIAELRNFHMERCNVCRALFTRE